MTWTCTEASFLERVKDHAMTVLRDDGLYRHVRFAKPNSDGDGYRFVDSFNLITWPGSLCYTGDMGTYVFSRVPDMFRFFPQRAWIRGETIGINPDYWAEKLDAVDRSDGARAFDEDRFREIVREKRKEWILEGRRHGLLTKEEALDLYQAIEDEVLPAAEDGEQAAHAAAYEFHHEVGGKTYRLEDFWEHNLTTFVGRYIWACYAIAWGIAKYNASKADLSKAVQG